MAEGGQKKAARKVYPWERHIGNKLLRAAKYAGEKRAWLGLEKVEQQKLKAKFTGGEDDEKAWEEVLTFLRRKLREEPQLGAVAQKLGGGRRRNGETETGKERRAGERSA